MFRNDFFENTKNTRTPLLQEGGGRGSPWVGWGGPLPLGLKKAPGDQVTLTPGWGGGPLARPVVVAPGWSCMPLGGGRIHPPALRLLSTP